MDAKSAKNPNVAIAIIKQTINISKMFAAISPLKSLSKKLIRGGITNIKIPIFKNIVNITTTITASSSIMFFYGTFVD